MNELKDIVFTNKTLHIVFIVCVLFLGGGFFAPPLGFVDNSVLIGIGELLGFACLFVINNALMKGSNLKIQHKDTSVEVNRDEKKK